MCVCFCVRVKMKRMKGKKQENDMENEWMSELPIFPSGAQFEQHTRDPPKKHQTNENTNASTATTYTWSSFVVSLLTCAHNMRRGFIIMSKYTAHTRKLKHTHTYTQAPKKIHSKNPSYLHIDGYLYDWNHHHYTGMTKSSHQVNENS